MVRVSRKSLREILRFITSLFFAIMIALLFRSLVFEPFYIPSGSMKPTLLIGDYVVVKKYTYGISRYSFPLGIAPIEGRLFMSAPERGDVVVFRLPSDSSIHYVKRLIGIPGDTIQLRKGRVYLNGDPIPKISVQDSTTLTSGESPQRYRETLPSGVQYEVFDSIPNGSLDNTPLYTVPDGHYFFLGDNRDDSQDSRVLAKVGYVPEKYLLGPVERVVLSSPSPFLHFIDWIQNMRYDRLWHSITE